MHKSIFGDCELINFSNVETLDDVDKILSNIFTNNPNFWGKNTLYYDYYGKDILGLVKQFIRGDISIYRYKYILPEMPNENDKRDVIKYKMFYRWSKAKYDTLPLLYWCADSFLNSCGYSLYNLSNVSKNITVVKNNYSDTKEDRAYSSPYHYTMFRENEENYTFLDKSISVYIGEIDVVKINNVISSGNNYVLVFPYFLSDEEEELKPGDEVYCYLFEIKDEVIENHRREFLELSRRVSQ